MSSYDRRRFLELLAAGAALPGPLMASAGQRSRLGVGIPLQQRPRAAASAGAEDWKEFSTFYFTYPAFGEKITREQIKRKIQDTVDSGSQVLMFFVIHEGYALYNSKVVERYPFATDFDVLAEVVAGAKANNLKLVACWMGVYGISRQLELHPNWQQVNSEGETPPLLSMCLNSPFQYHLLQQVKEVITEYPVDGIYFDGLFQWSGSCYCEYCRTKFRELYDRDLPKEADDPAMFRFRMDATAEIFHALRSAIDKLAPSVLLTMDVHGVNPPIRHDLPQLSQYLDVFLLESYWERTGRPIWNVGMQKQLVAAETKKPVWFPRWIARMPDRDYASVPAATIKLWVGEAMVNAGSPVAVEQNVFDVDRSQFATLQECFGRVRKIAPYLRGARRLPYVALLHSVATKEFVYLKKSERAYMDNLEGMYLALLNQHIPFQVVTERDVESGLEKERFTGLILANAMCLSDATVEAIGQFVKAGGGLVATYRSSFLNEKGEERDEMGLAPLLGIKTMGILVRKGGGGTAGTGREATTYYKVLKGSPVGKGLEGRLSAFEGGAVKIGDRGNARVVAQMLDYDYSKQNVPSALWAWWPGAPNLPLIITGEGAGRMAYFAGELDGAFRRQGWPEIAQLIANAVRWVAGPPPVEVEAPTSVQAEVYESPGLKDGLVCVLSNRTTNPLYLRRGVADEYHYVTEVVPVHDVRVKINFSAGRIKEATAITKQTVDARAERGYIYLTIPVLSEYEGVVIRW